ncbi:MAG TPA: NAD(P)/FAD-dependent oxidoreductase, partial [Candidatus Sulfotelmatobacter sp.]|nr:NAD(P)/FAD-dependent oxidoreductase [Candidatus Sulfotelmatobacter sp.]
EVIASSNGCRFREKMLLTHRGLSGPSILQVSSYWRKPAPIRIDLLPDQDFFAEFIDSQVPRTVTSVRSHLKRTLPSRFADRWLELHPPAGWTNSAFEKWERGVHAWTFIPDSTEGFEKAEVTVGGVDTDELSAKTMEARKVPGLFFVGEVVDVTGHLGGYNFQWAWASGAAAGRAL